MRTQCAIITQRSRLRKKDVSAANDRRGRLSHNTESTACAERGTGLPACQSPFPQPASRGCKEINFRRNAAVRLARPPGAHEKLSTSQRRKIRNSLRAVDCSDPVGLPFLAASQLIAGFLTA